MMMRDEQAIVCTILYGQDGRTPISAKTRRALYATYAPAGVPVEAVGRQLELIRDLVGLFSPDAVLERLELFSA